MKLIYNKLRIKLNINIFVLLLYKSMSKLHNYLVITLLFASNLIAAQISFTQDEDFSMQYPSKSLIAVGIADVNGDKRDDIIRVNNGTSLEVINISDDEMKISSKTQNIEVDDAWSMVVANIDNDRTNEILVSRAFDNFQIIKQEKNRKLNLYQSIDNEAYTQSSTMADINNDGWLDIFVCSDDSKSTILRNDGTGRFVKDDSLIDLRTKIESDNSGNYGSEWTDIDSDGDIDLYISKCKAGVTNPNDPRRVNTLYINDGNNKFTEQASLYNLNFGQQSWASSFADLDNDGDIDGIVIHHGSHHSLMENINNVFVDRSEAINQLETYAYQVLVRDFDNNGFQDILICGDTDYMLWNNGGFNFDVMKNPLKHFQMISLATGDINRDGFLDILGVYGGTALNAPGVLHDVLWMNDTNDNHFASFSLTGIESNANGVGAKITLYGKWGVMKRELKAGESYSISNSLNLHFGLGENNKIDRVEVEWPSGQKDVHTNIPADKFYQLTEGTCISPIKTSDRSLNRVCMGETVELISNTDSNWSDGNTSDRMTVTSEGIYFYELDQFGCRVTSESFFVDIVDESEEIELENQLVMACNDDPFFINYHDIEGNAHAIEIDKEHANANPIVISGLCSEQSFNVDFQRWHTSNPSLLNDTIELNQSVSYESDDDIWNWYFTENSAVPFHKGKSIEIENIEESRHYFIESEQHIEYPSVIGGEYNHKGSSQYSSDRIYGGMYFNVKKESILEEFSVYTDQEGERTIEIYDQNSKLIYEKATTLTKGRNRIILDALLPENTDYFITTNIEKNRSSLGFESPRLVRSNTQTNYPYQIDGLMSIINSSFGPSYYLYFYDWQVRQADFVCYSQRVPFSIIVDDRTSVNDVFKDDSVTIFPNPSNEIIEYNYPADYDFLQLRLLNSQGLLVKQHYEKKPIHISDLMDGLYIIEIIFKEKVVKEQVVILK